jgi:hypothetical protein
MPGAEKLSETLTGTYSMVLFVKKLIRQNDV